MEKLSENLKKRYKLEEHKSNMTSNDKVNKNNFKENDLREFYLYRFFNAIILSTFDMNLILYCNRSIYL